MRDDAGAPALALLEVPALRPAANDPDHGERDAAALHAQCLALDQLVADVIAGQVRLPDKATDDLPPRTVRPDGTDDGHEQTHAPDADSGNDATAGPKPE